MALELHGIADMRNACVLLLASGLILSSFACGDAGTGSSLGARRATTGKAPTADHSDDGDDGAAGTTANPNGTTAPPPPANPGTSTGEFTVALSNATPQVDLGESVDVDVTIEPKNGFQGMADLSATGLPQGATATFSPTQVALNTTPAKVKMTITAGRSTAVSTTPVVVTAKSGAVQATANANFKVNARMTLVIPVNIDAMRAAVGTRFIDAWGTELGANATALKTQQGTPITVLVRNADSVPHIIHGNNGFAHGDTAAPIAPNSMEMQNGAPRQRNLAVGANATGYLHEGGNGPSVSFRIQVQQAN